MDEIFNFQGYDRHPTKRTHEFPAYPVHVLSIVFDYVTLED